MPECLIGLNKQCCLSFVFFFGWKTKLFISCLEQQIRWYQKFGEEEQLPAKSAVNVIEGLEASLNEIRHGRARNCGREENLLELDEFGPI